MSSLIVTEFMTLDGVMEAPGGEQGHPHSGWVMDFASPEQTRNRMMETFEADALLIGRKTYEIFAAAWPARSGIFAARMNSMPKYVVSKTLREPEWHNTSVLAGNIPESIIRLKEKGSLLVPGSLTLVHALMQHNLVDEFRIMTFPVVLGSGRRLFPESKNKLQMRLGESCTFASGVIVNRYYPLRGDEMESKHVH